VVLPAGNPVPVDINDSEKTQECAPCADSFFSLKEQIMNLDDMPLADVDGDDLAPTDDEESIV
jgi:hypothetical protein